MAGLAKTNQFMLSTATVMLGTPAQLNDLNPTDHSIGLVKNFTLTSEPAYTELMQGVKGTVVESIMTANPVRASMEVYEYTAKNVTYALGLNASSVATATAATTLNGAIDASPATDELIVTSAAGFAEGDYILITKDTIDDFIVRQITDITSNTFTVDSNLPAIPNGAAVIKVNGVNIGSKEDQPYLAAKVAGKLTNGTPVVILIPKLRIVKGFNLAFIQNDFANLPFEFTLYDLVSTDPAFAQFGTTLAKLFKA